jgi:hypothetical protein
VPQFALHIDDARLAEKAAFIYCIYSPGFKAIYIGQTYNTFGALGRLTQHLSNTDNSTLRSRLNKLRSIENASLQDIDFFCHRLPKKRRFVNSNSDYREAVEYRVQYAMMNLRNGAHPPIGIISTVRHNAYVDLPDITKLGNSIAVKIDEWLRVVTKTSP